MIYANSRNSSRGVMIEAALGYFADARSDEDCNSLLTSHKIYSNQKFSDVDFHFSCHRRASSWAR